MRLANIFLALVVVFSPVQAWADWQYTRWSMSVDELALTEADSFNRLSENEAYQSPVGLVLATAEYSALGLKGYVAFAFDQDQLSGVIFTFAGKDADGVILLLQDQYGAPEQSPEPGSLSQQVWHWRDEDSGNNIRYIHFPASFDPDFLLYTPITSTLETGL